MIISNPSAFPRKHDAAESMEAGKDKAESFAGTSKDSYPLRR